MKWRSYYEIVLDDSVNFVLHSIILLSAEEPISLPTDNEALQPSKVYWNVIELRFSIIWFIIVHAYIIVMYYKSLYVV